MPSHTGSQPRDPAQDPGGWSNTIPTTTSTSVSTAEEMRGLAKLSLTPRASDGSGFLSFLILHWPKQVIGHRVTGHTWFQGGREVQPCLRHRRTSIIWGSELMITQIQRGDIAPGKWLLKRSAWADGPWHELTELS